MKIKKQPSKVAGMTVNDLLNMDIDMFNQLSKTDLREAVQKMASAGNKRLKGFEQRGESSPATRYLERSGGKLSTKGKDIDALRAEYTRSKDFLKSSTGTLRGWKKVKKDTIKSLNRQGVNVTVEQFDQLWKTYELLKEISPEVANKGLKYLILNEIADRIDDPTTTPEQIVAAMKDQINEIYERQEELKNVSGVSEFFEW